MTKRKIFVLDTNVLIHDPTAIMRFQEHDVYLPIVVLEELDRAKVGMSEVARNVRQVCRYLDELVEKANGDIGNGVQIPSVTADILTGRLHFHMDAVKSILPNGMRPDSPDNVLLGVTLDLGKTHPARDVVLVTKDINLRIKSHAIGVHAEDYTTDQVLDDANLLYPGVEKLNGDFWEANGRDMESWKQEGRTYYRITSARTRSWFPNQFLYTEDEHPFEAIVRKLDGETATLEVVRDFRHEKHKVWGINARNREQNFALNLLMDPEVDFITLLGHAGTGKTLMALAAALNQTLETRRYAEIIMTRQTVPVGEDIGFLPGTEEEKMGPWMGALEDNLDVLHDTGGQGGQGAWGRAATNDLLRSRIRIKSLNFMRGRTFLRKFLIIDEAQNLSPHQMKTLITRAGPGSKVVCLGNIAQIDTPYLTETTSGLTYVVDRFKLWEHSGHITLQRGERSRLADYASETL
jgi:PhoH-like ATPase